MHELLARSGGRVGVRLHAGNLENRAEQVRTSGGRDLAYRLLSLPLYLAELLSRPGASIVSL